MIESTDFSQLFLKLFLILVQPKHPISNRYFDPTEIVLPKFCPTIDVPQKMVFYIVSPS